MRTTPLRLVRPLLVAAALLGVASGCSTSAQTNGANTSTIAPTVPSSSPETTAALTTTPTPTSTTTVTTTPTTATSAPVGGVPTDAQWIAIINGLTARVDAMYADPSSADVSTACVEGSACFVRFSASLTDMTRQGVHVEGVPPTKASSITRVVDLAAPSNGTVEPGATFELTFPVVIPDNLGRVVDVDGNLVYDRMRNKGETGIWTRFLVYTPSDQELPWRFAN